MCIHLIINYQLANIRSVFHLAGPFCCVFKLSDIQSNIQNGGAQNHSYKNCELQYLSYFLPYFDQICTKMLVF